MSDHTTIVSPFSRGLRPACELAASRAHGDRLKYMAGCRCVDCRKANAHYENERQKARKSGDWNGLVSARNARAHILALSRQGVGSHSIADASDVGDAAISKIRSGKKKQIRARTERKILAVTAAMRADRSFVPARVSWRLIDRLIEEGYSKTFLARELGYKNRALQFNKHLITARNAHDIEVLYRRLTT